MPRRLRDGLIYRRVNAGLVPAPWLGHYDMCKAMARKKVVYSRSLFVVTTVVRTTLKYLRILQAT